MTPEALDVWLAEYIMGWRLRTRDLYGADGDFDAFVDADGRICTDPDYYHPRYFCPSLDIAQAIQCAERAVADLRIAHWYIGRHVGGMPDVGVARKDGSWSDEYIDEPTLALALCRALHEACATCLPVGHVRGSGA